MEKQKIGVALQGATPIFCFSILNLLFLNCFHETVDLQ
jgi:hypothetical protein